MPTFTVHAPPSRPGENANPERFVFVRDGFYFWAFVLAPLWFIVHRLWLALAGYVLLYVLIGVVSYFAGVPQWASSLVGVLIALLVGFEAPTLWRWTLERRGWKFAGFATGDELEGAEQRFYSAWAARKPQNAAPAPQAASAAPILRGAPSPSEVIGLFPEPERRP